MPEGIATNGIATLGISTNGIAFNGIAGSPVGVFLPPDRDLLAQWLIDYDGTLDEWGDKVVPALSSPESVGVGCLAFNGVDQDVVTPSILNYGSDDWTLSGWFLKDADAPTIGNIIDGREGNDDGVRLITGGNQVYASHNADDAISATFTYGDWHYALARKIGSTLYLTVDGVTNSVPITSGDIDVTAFATIGSASPGEYFKGKLAHVKSSGQDSWCCFNYPMTENPPLDHSGNGNDAPSSTATESTADGIPDVMRAWGYTYDAGYAPFNGVGAWADLGDTISADKIVADCFVDDFSIGVLVDKCGTDGRGAGVFNNTFNTTFATFGDAKTVNTFSAGNRFLVEFDYLLETIAVNGVNQALTTGVSLTTSSATSGIGARNTGASYSFFGKIYSVVVEHGGSILNLIPTDSNNLLNTVDDTLKPNIGSGDISAVGQGYLSGLAEKTAGAITITSTTGDFLNVVGLLGTEVVTVGGVSVNSAVDKITFPSAGLYEGVILVDGVEYSNLYANTGKGVEQIASVGSPLPNGTWSTGAAGLETLKGTRVVSGTANDVRVDTDYNLVGVVGSDDRDLWYNGSPSNLRATDPYYFLAGNYPNFWVDASGVAIDRTPAEIDAWLSFAYNLLIQWAVDDIGTQGRCIGIELLQYELDYMFTPSGYTQAKKYIEKYTDTCGGGSLEPLLDIDGEQILDLDGKVMFTLD